MLSLFPQFFDFAVPATAVLRLVAGIIFIVEGSRIFSIQPPVPPTSVPTTDYLIKTHAIFEIVGGILLFVGLFTQAVSLVLSLLLLIKIYREITKKQADQRVVSFYILLFFLTLSLLFLGPGMLSLDYPL